LRVALLRCLVAHIADSAFVEDQGAAHSAAQPWRAPAFADRASMTRPASIVAPADRASPRANGRACTMFGEWQDICAGVDDDQDVTGSAPRAGQPGWPACPDSPAHRLDGYRPAAGHALVSAAPYFTAKDLHAYARQVAVGGIALPAAHCP